MFVSYKWLQEYVDLSGVTADELAEKITKSGIEVEGVEAIQTGEEKNAAWARRSFRNHLE